MWLRENVEPSRRLRVNTFQGYLIEAAILAAYYSFFKIILNETSVIDNDQSVKRLNILRVRTEELIWDRHVVCLSLC